MLLKTLLFLFLLYLLIKVVSNLFLSSAKKGKGNVRFFYQTFKNVRDQQQQRQKKANPDNDELDEIEEAEYEDITEEKSGSKA